MINLSDFNKSIKINLETGEKVNRFNGDFEFYTLNKERFTTIKDGINALKSNANDIEVSYTLLPYICSINVDESLDKFIEMNEVPPCSEFIDFMIALTEYIKELLKQVDKIKEMNNKVDTLYKEYPILKEKQETTEEKIIRLTKEMQEEKDTKKKKEILLALAKLYEEVENNG
jgi:hypothetical protein